MDIGAAAHWIPEASVLEGLDWAALVVDADGIVRRANIAADATYAGTGPVLSGRPMTDIFEEGDRTALETVVRQVVSGEPWQGRVELRRADGTAHAADVSCRPLSDNVAIRGLLCEISDASPEAARRREARLLGERLTRLAWVTAELVRADDLETVTSIVIQHSADALGANVAALLVRQDDATFRLLGLRGGEPGEADRWAVVPVAARTVVGEAARTGHRVVVSGAAAIAERFPDMPDRGERSVVCLPLRRGEVIGEIVLSFPGVRTMVPAEIEFLEILADSCVQAMQRIEAQEAAAAAAERLAFIADASDQLSASLDYQSTLTKVADLVVPGFADWCAIDVAEDGRLHRLAVAHIDPDKVKLARDMQDRYPSDPNAARGAWQVLRTAEPQLIPEITDDMLRAGARDEEHLRIALELQLRSAIIVPLIARERVVGVMTWVAAESGRHYTEDDLAFAEELARRAAVAIDNAALHSETLAAAVRLQQAVLPAAMPWVPGWQVANYYDPSGRTDIGGDFYDVIPLVDGRVVVFVGDVMGRGVEAAAAMAHIRAAIRAYAAVNPRPRSVLGKLDRMFAQFPSEQLVTLAYLILDPGRDELVISNAGHPAPVVLRGDGRVQQLPDADGCPLAVLAEDRHERVVPFRSGDTVLLFTDGLIERRGEDISIGQQKVRDLAAGLADGDLTHALTRLVLELRDPSRDDDVAAVAVRRG